MNVYNLMEQWVKEEGFQEQMPVTPWEESGGTYKK